jgi:hypothetical protein
MKIDEVIHPLYFKIWLLGQYVTQWQQNKSALQRFWTFIIASIAKMLGF